jgi:cupin 2 domain-containing protein
MPARASGTGWAEDVVATPRAGRLFARIRKRASDEQIELLAHSGAVRIERIVSTGQASPPGFWYDQERPEFVVLLAGRARLRLEGERAARRLAPGDWIDIPAHARHRVEWTDPATPTVWLAVHYAGGRPRR